MLRFKIEPDGMVTCQVRDSLALQALLTSANRVRGVMSFSSTVMQYVQCKDFVGFLTN